MDTVLHRHRTIASALIIALVAFCANCVPAADPPSAHMTASAAMPDDCPMTSHDRQCAGESLKVQQGPVAKQVLLSAPSLVVTAIVVQPEPRLHESQRRATRTGAALKLPGVPAYLVDATFRI